MTFIETCSPFLLFDLPWKPEDKEVQQMFERQWGRLRRAVLFCLRQQHAGHHSPARLKQAREDFEEYAFAAEEVNCPAFRCRRDSVPNCGLSRCMPFCCQPQHM